VDTLSAVIPTLLGVVETEYSMHPQWSAMLLGMGAICSGLAQPFFAWLSDRWNTRLFGALGILLGALGIGFIGFAPNVPLVFVFYAVGMMGVGMFHPIAASTIGRIAGDRRGLALSWFFLFGMGGFFTGALIGPELATGTGSLSRLSILAIPALVMVVLLQLGIGKTQHKAHRPSLESASMRHYDVRSLVFLYVSCVFRFIVNMAIVYLIVRWMEAFVAQSNPGWSAEQVANHAAPLVGRANATMIVGQGLGGLAAGWLIANGNEKKSLIAVPILFSPALFLLAFLSPGVFGYAAILLTGIGFASMTPVAISVGQRLMPYHTSLASGVMLGGAWAIGSIGPMIAEFVHKRFGLGTALMTVGLMLFLSGISAMGLNPHSLKIKSR
jgi:MFS family permease